MSDTGQIPGEGLPENAGMVEQPGVPAPDAYTFLDPSAHVSEDDDLLLMPSSQGAWGDPPATGTGHFPGIVPAPLPEQSAYQPQPAAHAQPYGEPHAEGAAPVQAQEAPGVPAGYAPQAVGEAPGEATQGTHESGGRDTGAVDLNGVRVPAAVPAAQTQTQTPVRRPLHRGPATTEAPTYGATPSGGVVRSLADRGPAGVPQAQVQAPARHAVPAATGPEYFFVPDEHVSSLPGPQLGEIPPQSAGPWGAGAPRAAEPAAPEAPAADAAVAAPEVPEAQAVAGPVVEVPAAEVPVAEAPVAETVVPEAAAPEQAVPETRAVPETQVLPGAQAVPETDVQATPEAAAEAVPEPVADAAPEADPTPVSSELPAEAPATGVPEAVSQSAPAAGTAPAEDVAVPTAPQPVEEHPAERAPEAAPEAVEPEAERVPFAMEPAPAANAAETVQPEAVEPAAVPEAVQPEAVEPEAAEAAPLAAPVQPEAVAVEPAPEAAQPVAEQPEPLPVPPAEAVPAAVEPEPGPEVIETPDLTAPDHPAPLDSAEPAPAAPQETAEPLPAEAPPLAPPQETAAEATTEPAEPFTPAAPGYDDAEREAVLRVMRERRDIRNGFRSDPIPHEVLLRVLEAAHTAPSVGHSQPWDFVVIRSAETRRSMHELAQRQRDAYAKSLPKGRAKQFKELKIEAILDTPVNIVVTADPTRGGRHTLGRHTQPQMAPYSSALAVENLWLAARAEGLGVGWVSFFDEREMVRALGLPEHLEVVAYLCVGYVDEFPEEPELMQAGWSKRRPLSWVVHEETYGRRALPGEEPHDLLQETISNIRPLDAKALGEAWERQKRMTKPAGALGMLEIISAQLSGLSRACPPPIPEPAAVAIFAGDHGVHAQGVTAWPQEVTAQMVANFLGGGAVCNAFAAQVGAEVCVVDVGVAADLPATPGLLPRKVRAGTADFTTGPALSREDVLAAIEVGIETARDLVAAGNKGLLTGEMGIANTTASAALICVYTGMDPAEVTGRGTGINDEMHARKVDVVRRALDLHRPDPADPIGVLAAVGGLEHAAMAGFLLGGASLRTPVILDGVSAGAAALVARAIAPEALAACIAGHRSAEPGHVAALNKLGLRPLVDLDLRLGEGTGALLALPIVQSAARAMHEVATFDAAGVTEK